VFGWRTAASQSVGGSYSVVRDSASYRSATFADARGLVAIARSSRYWRASLTLIRSRCACNRSQARISDRSSRSLAAAATLAACRSREFVTDCHATAPASRNENSSRYATAARRAALRATSRAVIRAAFAAASSAASSSAWLRCSALSVLRRSSPIGTPPARRP
jgi:hypothetical protein